MFTNTTTMKQQTRLCSNKKTYETFMAPCIKSATSHNNSVCELPL